jgi:hypothetical protein
MTTGLLFDTIGFTTPARRHVTDTSKSAHTALVNAGKLNGRKGDVLAWLLDYGPHPMTAAELSVAVHGDHSLEHVLHIRRGLSDLRKDGLVCKGEDRLCRITGTKANTWKSVTR